MSIINQLSSALGQKGNDANISLAKDIARTQNSAAIQELVHNLEHKDKKIQADCIKTLYETAYITPELIADHYATFLGLLSSKNNRLVWGGMIALKTITAIKHQEIFVAIDLISDTVNKGSVITIDAGVEIFARLNTHPEYQDKVEVLLIDQLWKCPIKQLPKYVETAGMSITAENKEIYQNIIEERKAECEKDAQLKRLDRVLKQMAKI